MRKYKIEKKALEIIIIFNFYDYMYFSTKYPFIRHFLGNSKPFQTDKGHIEDWWYFARKSKFYVRKTRDLNKVFNLRFE